MSVEVLETPGSDEAAQGRRLSYKFQRLRERVRSAIESGELHGKLPGERVLARRFKVNAKTLSKALTDLAAEGLLERNIGLGTFVRGSSSPKTVQKCLVLHDPEQAGCPIIARLAQSDDIELQTHDVVGELPPSLLNPHRSIIVCSKTMTDDALRDLVVRGKIIVLLDRSAGSYTTHAVVIDRLSAAADLSRRMIRSGHSNLMLIGAERPIEMLRDLPPLLPASVSVRAGTLDDVRNAADLGVTGLICTSPETARHASAMLAGLGIDVPEQVSITAMGRINDDEDVPCSGQYVRVDTVVQAIRHLLSESTPHRPIALWLGGEFTNQQTIALPANA